MATAVLSGLDALAQAIRTGSSPPLGLASDRFYRDGEVPTNALLGYGILGQVQEGESGFANGQIGGRSSYRVHWWAATPTKALRLYEWFHGLVHDQRLTLAGNAVWRCKVRLLPGSTDADGRASQVIADVEMETLAL